MPSATLNVVEPGGRSRHWVQRLTVDGRRRDLGLGGYPHVGLAEARVLRIVGPARSDHYLSTSSVNSTIAAHVLVSVYCAIFRVAIRF